RPRCAVDDYTLARLDGRRAQQRDCAECAVRGRRSLLERHAVRDARDHSGLAHAYILSIRARADAEHAVAEGELGDGFADGLDLACELEADGPLLRPEDTEEETADEVLGAATPAVAPGRRRRMHTDEHLVVLRHPPFDVS